MITKFIIENIKALLFSFTLIFVPLSLYVHTQGGITRSYIEKHVLTNGEKTVVFQGMMHIGLRSFYEQVGQELNYYRDSGYKIYQECFRYNSKIVSKDDPNYSDAVKKYNGFKDIYAQSMSKYPVFTTTKYTYQDFGLYNYIQYDDECADLNRSEFTKLTDELTKKHDIKKETVDEVSNSGDHIEAFVYLNKYEKSFIYVANIMNLNLNHFFDKTLYKFYSYFDDSLLLDLQIGMEARNKNLANSIIKEPNNYIYISYGSAHFYGVLESLKEHDKNWKIIETTEKIVLGE